MKDGSFFAAVEGMGIWYRMIENKPSTLFLILPDGDQEIEKALSQALSSFLPRHRAEYHHVAVLYTAKETLGCFQDNRFQFVHLGQRQMRCLTSYCLLTCKLCGALYRKNVKLISRHYLYGGQFEKMIASGIYKIENAVENTLVYE